MLRSRLPVVDPFGIGVDSYSRLGVVLRNRDRMERAAWFVQLGDAWSRCDAIAESRFTLCRVLAGASRSDLDLMMTDDEREALARMPERFEVFRGCYGVNRDGLSWSVDRACAESFPTLHRYRRAHDAPILRRGWVDRAQVVFKNDRAEAEVIAHLVMDITETPM